MTSEQKLFLSSFFRLILGAVFVYASIDKILHPGEFVQNIIDYDLVAIPVARVLSHWLPWLEFSTGGLLLFGVWVRAGAFVTTGMLLVFIFAIASAMARGLSIQCGCFETGDMGEIVGWNRLITDILLLVPCVWLSLYPSSKFALTRE